MLRPAFSWAGRSKYGEIRCVTDLLKHRRVPYLGRVNGANVPCPLPPRRRVRSHSRPEEIGYGDCESKEDSNCPPQNNSQSRRFHVRADVRTLRGAEIASQPSG